MATANMIERYENNDSLKAVISRLKIYGDFLYLRVKWVGKRKIFGHN